MIRKFDGQKTARLGTPKRPAAVTVQTQERLAEVTALLEENGWSHTIQLDPDAPEDVADLETLLSPVETRIAPKKTGP